MKKQVCPGQKHPNEEEKAASGKFSQLTVDIKSETLQLVVLNIHNRVLASWQVVMSCAPFAKALIKTKT